MKNLNHNHYQKILEAVEILNSDIDPQNLPKRMLNAVNHVVSSDITSFEVFNEAGEHKSILIYDPVESVSAKQLEIYAQYVAEHPIFQAVVFNRRYDAIKISDFTPDQKFVQTGIYNEFYRSVGVNRQISVTMRINRDFLVVCTLSRHKRDFDEIEQSSLNLMSPHFTSAVQNANSFKALQIIEENCRTVVESSGRKIIILDVGGKVKYLSEQSNYLLKKYFDEKLKVNGLPNTLYRWVRKNLQNSNENDFRFPPKPLILTAHGEKLTVQFNFNRNSGLINLLLNEEKKLFPENLIVLGLTKRESEILYWISFGKTNAEISLLSDISPRTVQKHIENICNKLGAENRTAAAMRVTEIIH